jgi:protein O-mannosyl-transferase
MNRSKFFVLATLLVIITFFAFSPILKAGFTNWDDQIMVTQNTKILSMSWNSLVTMFTSFHERLYHPLVLISYAIDLKFFGMNPFVFHMTSLMFHLLNTALVFWFIYLLSKKPLVAFMTALLFGIHPMHVESVAWISERKDVVYAFFFLISLITYMYYLISKKNVYYLAAFLLFFASLMSKSMAMMLPVLLLVIDYYQGRKFDYKTVISEKLPFFGLSVIFGFLTIVGHYEPGVKGREFTFSFIGNMISAAQGLVFYVIKLVAPFKLACLYPAPDKLGNIPTAVFWWAPVIILLFAAVIFMTRKYSKVPLFGSLFFFFAILPVTQILPVGLVIPADRYTYIPYIGFFYIFAEGIYWLYNRYVSVIAQAIVILLTISIFTGCFVMTWQRVHVWQNSKALWEDVIKNYNNVQTAYYNLAEEYFLVRWDLDTAIKYFTLAIAVDPKEASSSYINRGLVYYYKKDYKKALYNYDLAEKVDAKVPEIYLNRGNSLNAIGQQRKAIEQYNKALKLKPSVVEGWYNRGNVYMSIGDFGSAIKDYSHAIKLNAKYADAFNNRGNAYFKMKDMDNAYYDFTMAIMSNPKYADAYYNRAIIYAQNGDVVRALDDVLKARSLGMQIEQRVIDSLTEAIKKQPK